MTEAWSRVLVSGPLAPHVRGFTEELATKGYAELTVAEHARLTAQLSRWMVNQALETADLTPARMDEFVQVRPDRLSHRPLEPLLHYLRRMGLAPAPALPEPTISVTERLLDRYCRYLLDERGLVETTVREYERRARLFLAQRSIESELHLEDLTAAEIKQFVLRECEWRSIGSAKCFTKALRSLLRFFFVEGWTATELATAVPAVANWRASSLPRALDAQRVALLLGSCDRGTAIGRRDYAILVLLARLGLRADAAYQASDRRSVSPVIEVVPTGIFPAGETIARTAATSASVITRRRCCGCRRGVNGRWRSHVARWRSSGRCGCPFVERRCCHQCGIRSHRSRAGEC